MKILQIMADGSPGGGATNVLGLIQDINRLKGSSTRVSLITQSNSFALKRAEELDASCFGLDFFHSRLDFPLCRNLTRLIARIKPDLIHVHGGRAAFSLSLTSAPARIPTLYTVRGFHFLQKTPLLRLGAVLAERLISQRVAATVLVCDYDRALGEQWSLWPRKHQCRVIYNGINRSVIPHPVIPAPKTVGWLGRFDYQKDPQFIVAVAALLADAGYRFKMIGGGELEDEVKTLIAREGLSDVVTITGSLPHDQALAELSSMSVFVLPSRWEGLPIAPVEAMWMQIPVIASQVSGIPEIIESGISGILIRERDPQKYAAEIESLTNDTDKRRRIVDAAVTRVQDLFLRENTAAAYLKLYDDFSQS